VQEKAAAVAAQAEVNDLSTKDDRRQFLKKTALGGIALTGLMGMSVEDTIARTTSGVPRFGSPSDLKITDMRYTTSVTEPAQRMHEMLFYALTPTRASMD
jgi:hypothetical protein